MVYDCASQLTRKEKRNCFFCGINREIKCSPKKAPGFKNCPSQIAWGFEQSNIVEDIPVDARGGTR